MNKHTGLTGITDDVRGFHIAFGHPAPTSPQMQEPEFVERRAKWIESEVTELREAKDLQEQADAYVDIIYFAVGGLVELGLKFTHMIWNLVHGANMAKLWDDGLAHKDENGKVIKPEGWTAPDAEIGEYIEAEMATASGEVPNPLSAEGGNALAELGDAITARLSLMMGAPASVVLHVVNQHTGQVGLTSNMENDELLAFMYAANESLQAAHSAGGETVQ